MDPRQLFMDERLKVNVCAHCGDAADTGDHAPSKVLLDDPLPENLAVVPACRKCNGAFSKDEPYLACFLECAARGSADDLTEHRLKVRKALEHSEGLRASIAASATRDAGGNLVWIPDDARVRRVIMKLARCHAYYESGYPHLDEPEEVEIQPMVSMSATARQDFERAGAGEPRGWPEIGSRAFMRAVGEPPYDTGGPWIVVQPGGYRYAVDDSICVRIVIAEYLACTVWWG